MSVVLSAVWVHFTTANDRVADYYYQRYLNALSGETAIEPFPEDYDVIHWEASKHPYSVDVRISKHGQPLDLEAIRDHISTMFTPDVTVGLIAHVDIIDAATDTSTEAVL